MTHSKEESRHWLRQLGRGESIESICQEASMSREQFESWWKAETSARVPKMGGRASAPVDATVEIERDTWSIPHIYAQNDVDLFVGFGYAMAQDRLFQLDYLRRRALGRLAEILGRVALPEDTLARTVGLPRLATEEWSRVSQETRTLLEAFTRGVNALQEQVVDQLPIEFDLLDYRPEEWSPIDFLAIEAEFQWYLTGRLHVIAIPELAKRVLGDGPLYRDILLGESDNESILPPGSYPSQRGAVEPIGFTQSAPDEGSGSNNWVVSGDKSLTGHPLVASDPHVAINAQSIWYEVHLVGESFNTAGAAYTGIPALILGRNEHVAWSITNNICSQRDLYQEKTDPERPNHFLYDGKWEATKQHDEVIRVKGETDVTKTIVASRHGPIVDELLPPAARETGPVSLRWLRASRGGWLESLLQMNRSNNAEEFRASTRSWHVPTFSLIFADTNGRIGYTCAGRIPIREKSERAYRPGWDPGHQWQGLIAFEDLPHVFDPPRGWLASANNRVAADDFPYPLSGTWSSGHRAERIRELLESTIKEKGRVSLEDFRRMHQDVLSLRACECVPGLLAVLAHERDAEINRAATYLREWNRRVEVDSIGATLFDVFFTHWERTVAAERFTDATMDAIRGAIGGLANRLLTADPNRWFMNGDRTEKIVSAFRQTLATLRDRLGNDMSEWQWGRLHHLRMRHPLSSRGSLGELLDIVSGPVKGDVWTVCNTGFDADCQAGFGGGYRLLHDLSASPPGMWAIEAESQSGHPGSPHYADQFDGWSDGQYHYLSLDRSTASESTQTTLRLEQ